MSTSKKVDTSEIDKKVDGWVISQFIEMHSKRVLGFIITDENSRNTLYPVPEGIKNVPIIFGANIIGDESDFVGSILMYTEFQKIDESKRNIIETSTYGFLYLYGLILSREKYYIDITKYDKFLESNKDVINKKNLKSNEISDEIINAIFSWSDFLNTLSKKIKEEIIQKMKQQSSSSLKERKKTQATYSIPSNTRHEVYAGGNLEEDSCNICDKKNDNDISICEKEKPIQGSQRDQRTDRRRGAPEYDIDKIKEPSKIACDSYKKLNLVKFNDRDVVNPKMLTTISYNIHCRPRVERLWGRIGSTTKQCGTLPQFDDMQDVRAGHICTFLNNLDTDIVCLQEVSDVNAYNIIQDLLYNGKDKYKYSTHDLMFYEDTNELNLAEKAIFPKVTLSIEKRTYNSNISQKDIYKIFYDIDERNRQTLFETKDYNKNEGTVDTLSSSKRGYYLGGIGKLTEAAFRSFGGINSKSDVTESSSRQFESLQLVSPSGILTFSKYPIVYQDAQTFIDRPTADAFVFKGIVYTKIRLPADKGIDYVNVFNTHPSPYVLLDFMKSYPIAVLAALSSTFWIAERAYYAVVKTYAAIEEAHTKQIEQLKDFIELKKTGMNLKNESILIMGDMNINKYDTYERPKEMNCTLGNPLVPCYIERDAIDTTSAPLKDAFLKNENLCIDKDSFNPIRAVIETIQRNMSVTRGYISNTVVYKYPEDEEILKKWNNINQIYNNCIAAQLGQIPDTITKYKVALEVFFRLLIGYKHINSEEVKTIRTNFRSQYTKIRNKIETFRFQQSKLKTGREYCNMIKNAGTNSTIFKAPLLIVDPCYWNIIDGVYLLTGKNKRETKQFTVSDPDLSETVWSKLDASLPKNVVNNFSGRPQSGNSGQTLKLLYVDKKDGVEASDRTSIVFDETMGVKIIPGRKDLETPFGYYTWDGTRYGTNIEHTRGNTMTYSPFWPVFLYEMIDHVLFSGKQPKHSFVSILRPLSEKPMRVFSKSTMDKTCLDDLDEFESPVWYDLSDHYPIIGRFIFNEKDVSLSKLDTITDTKNWDGVESINRPDKDKLDNFLIAWHGRGTDNTIVLDVVDEDCVERNAQ